MIVGNPPYGERLSDKPAVEKNVYQGMGEAFKNLDTWSIYILTSHEKFEECFGRKATKKKEKAV
ncbi:hypothetical protein BsIDN1_38520 [Bacillus safensis]|uniref:Ribosomal RNA large subunit methyltransferase K/L-like methyltransferase domain-containing protein n=1 Tax=Bacillus safensis TaxID=561879 RepID=A0A5S9MDP6_BACIA|nr:hypothetical protein BsIDN1_38520 [Bacillus safensis]